MAQVTVTPQKFAMVFFEPDRIKAVAEETAAAVGLPADLAEISREAKVDADRMRADLVEKAHA